MKLHVLVTRSEKQALATAEALDALGHTSLIESLLQVQPTFTSPPSGSFDGMLVTSANALPAMQEFWDSDRLKSLPLLATGAATAAAARAAGFEKVLHVDGSALDLVAQVPDWMETMSLPQSARLLYPCAEQIAHDLTTLLTEKRLNCRSWPVYRTLPRECFSQTAADQLQADLIDCVLLYSRRTAQTFVRLMNECELPMKKLLILALSRDIVDSLPDELRPTARFPDRPRESDLLALLDK